MANPIQHAKQSLDNTHDRIQPYMPSLFQRLANNYALLVFAILFVSAIGVPLLLRFVPIPASTAHTIGFALNLLILFYGWRYLENRNHATALFVLYTRYSRQRRDLNDTIELAESDVLEDENPLYIQADLLEEHASAFLDAVEEQQLKAHQAKG